MFSDLKIHDYGAFVKILLHFSYFHPHFLFICHKIQFLFLFFFFFFFSFLLFLDRQWTFKIILLYTLNFAVYIKELATSGWT